MKKTLILFVFWEMATAIRDKPSSCEDVQIVTRDQWKARTALRISPMKLPLQRVIIEHTADSFCHNKEQCIRNIQFIQDYHMDYKGWADIAYGFLIGGDGSAYEGAGWTGEGAHAINFNFNSLGVAFMGNFMNVTPSEKMVNASINLINCGVDEGYLSPTREIHGHRDVACTMSPGDKLYAIIRTWDNYKGGRIPLYDCSGY